MSAQFLIRRILTCLAGVTILLGCQPTASKDISPHHSSQISETQNYDIVGFSPIEAIIPDWDEVRKQGVIWRIVGKGGGVTEVRGRDRFLCDNALSRYYEIDFSDPKILRATVLADLSELAYVPVPQALKKRLMDIIDINSAMNEDSFFNAYQLSMLQGFQPQEILTFDDGWLLAFGRGEFGGMLLWVESNRGFSVIDKNNTNDLLLHEGYIYSAHSFDYGFDESEYILKIKKNGNRFKSKKIITPSAVRKLVALGDRFVGLLDDGLIYVERDLNVNFRLFPYHDLLAAGPNQFGLLPSGDVYIAGKNIIRIYKNLPHMTHPSVYIPNDCIPIFEKTIDLWDK